jgi:hypothetical protein
MTLSVNQLVQCRMTGLLFNNDLGGMCNEVSNLKCCLRICPDVGETPRYFSAVRQLLRRRKQTDSFEPAAVFLLVLSERYTMVQIEGCGVWATPSGRRESAGLTGTRKWVLRAGSQVHSELVCVGWSIAVDCGVWYRGRKRKCSPGIHLQYRTP